MKDLAMLEGESLVVRLCSYELDCWTLLSGQIDSFFARELGVYQFVTIEPYLL